jgi:xylulokinase
MDAAYYITYDFGTSSLKAALLDEGFGIAGAHYAPYPIYSDAPGHMEQKVENYWQAFCEATRALIDGEGIEREQVAGLAISQTTAAVILADADGEPLGNCIIWIDSRAARQAAEINERAGYELYQGKNVPPKVRWLQQHRPELFEKAAYLLDVSAYLYKKLTGEYAYDLTGAFGSQMLEDGAWAWSREKLGWAGIPMRMLPPRIVGATEPVGSVLPLAARETGLPAGAVVFGGCSDNANGQIGAGCIRPGDVHLYIGSSSWFEITTDDASSHRGNYPSAMAGLRYHFRCTDTACNGIDAVLRALYPSEAQEPQEDIYALMEQELRRARADAQELIFLPYLFGEQDPVADMDVRGTLLNITPQIGRHHILCAFVEGVAFNLRWMKEQQLERTGRWTDKPIRTYGGGAQSGEIMRIFADVLGDTLVRLEKPRTTGNVGLGVCVAVGLGRAKDFYVLDGIVKEEALFRPNAGRKAGYDRKYAAYRGAYEALKGTYRALSGRNAERAQC